MTKEEFRVAYIDFLKIALEIAGKARREGVLALKDDIDPQKVAERDIFHYGLMFVVDAMAQEIIDDILFNIIQQEEGLESKLKFIQKQAVLHIQSGIGPDVLRYILNSYTDIPIGEQDKIMGS